MKRGELLKKTLSLMLMLVLSAGLVLFSAPESYAASSGKLIKSVKHYVKSGSKWKWNSSTTYKYNKKNDPVKIYMTSKVGKKKKYKVTCTIKYTYKNGKKTEAKQYRKENNGPNYLETKTTYDSKGRPSVVEFYDADDASIIYSTSKYVYGKNGYITKIKGTNGDTVIKYKWNGKKAKALKSYLITDGEKFKMAQTSFNKKGFVYKPRVYTQADPVMIYTYKMKNGQVNTINLEMQEGYDRYYEKYKISYTKKRIPQKRYRAMINGVVCGNYPDTIGTVWY